MPRIGCDVGRVQCLACACRTADQSDDLESAGASKPPIHWRFADLGVAMDQPPNTSHEGRYALRNGVMMMSMNASVKGHL